MYVCVSKRQYLISITLERLAPEKNLRPHLRVTHTKKGKRTADFLVAATAHVRAGPIEWPPELDAYMAPVQGNLVKGPGSASTAPSPGKAQPREGASARSPRPGKSKERRICRFPLLYSHTIVAERLEFTNPGVLSQSPSFLKGVKHFVVPANYEPLDESARLSAVTRCTTMKH